MALRYPDRVRETCTGAGTGALTLTGSPPSKYRTIASAISDGDEFPGVVEHQTAEEWQSGIYRYTAPDTLELTEFRASSTGSAISWSAGTKDVKAVLLGSDMEEVMTGPGYRFTPTISTSAYVDGDVLFNPVELTGVFASLAGRRDLLSVGITDLSKQGLSMDLLFFTQEVSLGTMGDACSADDAIFAYITGGPVRINGTSFIAINAASGGNMRALVAGLGVGFLGADDSKDLWVGAIARGGATFAASNDLQFEITFA